MTEPQDPYSPPSDPYGTPPSATPPTPYGAPQYGAPQYGAPQYGAPVGQRRNGLGTAALVLGIVAILPCSWLFVVPAVLALVFGLIGRGRVKRREATNGGAAMTGVVLGAISLVIGVVVWGFFLANADAFQRLQDCQDAHPGDQTAQDQCAKDFVHDVFGVDTSNS